MRQSPTLSLSTSGEEENGSHQRVSQPETKKKKTQETVHSSSPFCPSSPQPSPHSSAVICSPVSLSFPLCNGLEALQHAIFLTEGNKEKEREKKRQREGSDLTDEEIVSVCSPGILRKRRRKGPCRVGVRGEKLNLNLTLSESDMSAEAESSSNHNRNRNSNYSSGLSALVSLLEIQIHSLPVRDHTHTLSPSHSVPVAKPLPLPLSLSTGHSPSPSSSSSHSMAMRVRAL